MVKKLYTCDESDDDDDSDKKKREGRKTFEYN